MLDYVQQLSETEGVTVAPGVLPLVVRAGGGSVRDTLSLLDQLIAGSESADPSTGSGTVHVDYERAVALLGYTHGALLDEVVDAVAALDAGAAFAAVDRVVQTGQDPRRFVEDLLERLRDLIVVAATRDGAASVLRGVPQDELDHMAVQASSFGSAELSRAADVVNTALTEMTGATSPRLHLELMVARLLVPATDDSERGALARVERLERRIGIEGDSAPAAAAPAGRVAAPPAPRVETKATPKTPVVEPVETPVAEEPEPDAVSTGSTTEPPEPAKPVTASQLRDAWPEVLEALQKAAGRLPWAVVSTTTVHAFDGEVLTLGFSNESDVAGFRPSPGAAPGESVSEQLRAAILEVLGVRVKFLPRVEAAAAPPPPEPEPEAEAEPEPQTEPAGWTVAEIPTDSTAEPAEPAEPEVVSTSSTTDAAPGNARYGEAVVRELLNASFLEEQSISPRDQAVTLSSDAPEA
jgi:DNA polymerase-3 subunit gamma/tau